MGGPIWADELHDVNWLKEAKEFVEANKEKFGTNKRMIGVLASMIEEHISTAKVW